MIDFKSWKPMLLVGAFLIGGAHVARAADDWRPDGWVTAKTKIALLTTDDVGSTTIDVDTVNGMVTLHGKVASEAEREKAAAVAKSIDGVKEVRNLLQVVPPAKQKATDVSDSVLKERVEKSLKADRSLADSDIDVESVNKGVVLLDGDAASLDDHVRAIEITRAVPGVRDVNSEVKSPDTFSETQSQGVTKDVAQGATDMYITSATKLRLLADSETPALEINVDTRDGIVTLFGIVPTQAAKQSAEKEARKVSGVKAVKNELQVVAKEKRDTVAVRDDELKKKVDDALETPPLNTTDIAVEVKNGVVRLTGKVPTQSHRLAAATVARSVAGVRSVQDDLQVSPQG